MTAWFRTRRGSFAVALIATLAVALALAGCGGSSHPPRTTTHSATGPGTASASATTPASPPTPVASVTYDSFINGAVPVTISIYSLRRDGPFMDLYFTYRCASQTSCAVGFGPEARNGPQGNANNDDEDPDGIFLIDPVNQQAYYPVRDGQGHPYSSTAPEPNQGQTDLSWVRFPAPAASVSAVDITFPYGPAFSNVPVDSGSVPTPPSSWVVNPAASFSQDLSSTNTVGLTLPVSPLSLEIADRDGSDQEAGTKSKVTLSSDVLFAFGKATLSAKAHGILTAVADQIKRRAKGAVHVTGYTDSIGSDAVNVPLSVHRADAVVRALKAMTPGVSYSASGEGAADPIAPNAINGHDDPAGRAQNRRVTVAFTATRPSAPAAPAQTATNSGPSTTTGNVFSFGEGLFDNPRAGSVYQGSDISLTRDGNLLLLGMTLTCVRATRGSCNTEFDLGGTSTAVPPYGPILPSTDLFSTSGFYLEDPASGTFYLAARDSYGNPVDDYVSSLSRGQNFRLWAYFSAPPASVDTLKLLAPASLASITDIPKSTGSVNVAVTPAPSGIGSMGVSAPSGGVDATDTTSTPSLTSTGAPSSTGTTTSTTATTSTLNVSPSG